MELEFDKEIDAILRKGRSGQIAAVKAATASHLDADSIAAFAENALPPRAKLLYMEHFADCDRCRKDLSQVVRMNSAAVAAEGTAVSSVAAAAVAEPSWLSKLFRTPNLAMAMGALVLTFGGVLGYLVIQNGTNVDTSTISKVTDQEQNKGVPSFNGDASAVSNSANTIAANATPPAAPTMPAASANSAANSTASGTGSATEAKQPESGYSMDGTTDISKSGEVAPAAPITVNKPAAVEERKDGDDKTKEQPADEKIAKREYDDRSRDTSPAAPKRKTDTGPSRSGTGPRQDNTYQNQTQNQVVGGVSATRSSGGKNFESRNGVWYDTAYKGQSTTSVKRGTENYIRLDSGLRSIADSLGGTVIIVWKDKAYRIQ